MKFATELDRVNPKFSKNHIYLLYSNLCFVYSLCRAQTVQFSQRMLSEVVSGLVSNRRRVELEESSIFLIFKMVTLIFLFLFVANFLPPLLVLNLNFRSCEAKELAYYTGKRKEKKFIQRPLYAFHPLWPENNFQIKKKICFKRESP